MSFVPRIFLSHEWNDGDGEQEISEDAGRRTNSTCDLFEKLLFLRCRENEHALIDAWG
jgi:hypothetical protein